MQLSGRTYDILKWCTMILIPACTTLYVALSAIWGFPYAAEIAKTSAALCAFLGAVLGISSAQYYKDDGEWLDDDPDPDAKYWDDDEEQGEDADK